MMDRPVVGVVPHIDVWFFVFSAVSAPSHTSHTYTHTHIHHSHIHHTHTLTHTHHTHTSHTYTHTHTYITDAHTHTHTHSITHTHFVCLQLHVDRSRFHCIAEVLFRSEARRVGFDSHNFCIKQQLSPLRTCADTALKTRGSASVVQLLLCAQVVWNDVTPTLTCDVL